MTTPPPAVLAPGVALERLEQEWRERAKQYYGTRTIGRDVLTNCADELATLRASLAQQGEGKPVAVYNGLSVGSKKVALITDDAIEIGTPLFAHPAAVDAVEFDFDDFPAPLLASGPEGEFFTRSHALAEALIAGIGHRDEWTITDTTSPTPAGESGAVEDAARFAFIESTDAVLYISVGGERALSFDDSSQAVHFGATYREAIDAARRARGGSHD